MNQENENHYVNGLIYRHDNQGLGKNKAKRLRKKWDEIMALRFSDTRSGVAMQEGAAAAAGHAARSGNGAFARLRELDPGERETAAFSCIRRLLTGDGFIYHRNGQAIEGGLIALQFKWLGEEQEQPSQPLLLGTAEEGAPASNGNGNGNERLDFDVLRRALERTDIPGLQVYEILGKLAEVSG